VDPNILAIRTLGDTRVAHLAVNPRVTGVELPLGTIAVYEGNVYQKNGVGNTDYAELPDLTKDAHFIDSKLGLKNASEATIIEIALGATDNPSIETFNSQNLSIKHNSLERLSISPSSVSILDHQQSAVVQVSQGEVSVLGGLDLNNNTLSGLAEPVEPGDAATRAFVTTVEEGLSVDISDLSDSVDNDLSLLEGNLQSQINDRIELAEKGVALGVATLDSQARIPSNQLPLDAVTFEGTWDASTNTPALADGTGTNGEFYIIDTDGTQDLGSGPIEFNEGNRVFYNGTIWKEVGASDRVISVNEKVGVVTLDTSDIDHSQSNAIHWTVTDNSSIKGHLDEVGERLTDTELDLGSLQQRLLHSNIVYVSKNGDDVEGDGSVGHPFETIQAAIDNIQDASNANKYVVFVNPGRYEENLTLKPFIALVGHSRETTLIDSTSPISPSTHGRYKIARITVGGSSSTGGINFETSSFASGTLLELEETYISNPNGLTFEGRGAGTDFVQLRQIDVVTSFNVSGANCTFYDCAITADPVLSSGGTEANSFGETLEVTLKNVLLYNATITANTNENAYLQFFACRLGGTTTLQGDGLWVNFDAVSFPHNQAVTGDPTIDRFTRARAISYDNSSSALAATELQQAIDELASSVSSINDWTTDDIDEGAVNFFYTDQRFDDRFNTKDTDDLTESATNKFLTTGIQVIEGEKTIQDRLNIESSVVNNVNNISATEIDWSTGNVYEKDIVADTTFTFTGDSSGQTIIVKIQNLDNATRTINFPAGVLWSDGIVVDTIPQDGTHIYTFIKVGTTVYASALENMS
jgi:hypothetical protein